MEKQKPGPINPDPVDAGLPRLEPITAHFGALVHGLDLNSPHFDRCASVLERALIEHQFLLFRGLSLNEDQQARLAGIFGQCREQWPNPYYPAGNTKVRYLSNVDSKGQAIGQHPDPDSTFWHVDGSWRRVPYRATMLYAVQVSEQAGSTELANLHCAWNALDATQRNRLQHRYAEHHLDLSRAARHGKTPGPWMRRKSRQESLAELLKWWLAVWRKRRKKGPILHPLMKTHSRSGRPALFIGDHAWRVTGCWWPIGIRRMRELNARPLPDAAVYCHDWQNGDLLVWDNESVMHRAGVYDLRSQVRIMRRCIIE